MAYACIRAARGCFARRVINSVSNDVILGHKRRFYDEHDAHMSTI